MMLRDIVVRQCADRMLHLLVPAATNSVHSWTSQQLSIYRQLCGMQ
jgi:hypothetical protein